MPYPDIGRKLQNFRTNQAVEGHHITISKGVVRIQDKSRSAWIAAYCMLCADRSAYLCELTSSSIFASFCRSVRFIENLEQTVKSAIPQLLNKLAARAVSVVVVVVVVVVTKSSP
jgi:hypothetical protein